MLCCRKEGWLLTLSATAGTPAPSRRPSTSPAEIPISLPVLFALLTGFCLSAVLLSRDAFLLPDHLPGMLEVCKNGKQLN